MPPMHDTAPLDPRKEKKIRRLLLKSAWSFGIGVGLILLRFAVAPFLGVQENAEKAVLLFAWCVIAYGGALVLSFVFLKKHMLTIDLILTWLVMPALFVKLLTDAL